MGAVKSFANSVSNAFSAFGSAAFSFAEDLVQGISDAVSTLWQDFIEPALETIMGWFGIKGEFIYSVQVSTSNLLEADTSGINQLALVVLKSIRADTDYIPPIKEYLLTGNINTLNLMNIEAFDDYYYGYPDAYGTYAILDVATLETVIETKEGENITLITSGLSSLSDNQHVLTYLQENESYTADDNIIMKGVEVWYYAGYTLELDDTFTVNLDRTTLSSAGAHDGTINDSGAHDGLANASVLTDISQAWTVDEWIGGTVTNTTDGSSATIDSNTANTLTATLTGGTDNDWDIADAYTLVRNDDGVAILEDTTEAWPVDQWIGETLFNTTDLSSGVVISNTATTITATLAGGTNNYWDVGDTYTIDNYEATTLGYPLPAKTYGIYYLASYTLDSDPTYTKYFSYQSNTGTYPLLDTAQDEGTQDALIEDAFIVPVMPIKLNAVYLADNKEGEAYKSVKKMLNMLTLDIDALTESVQANPDHDLIRDVFVQFGLSIYSDIPAVQKAVYLSLSYLYITQGTTKADYDAGSVGSQRPFNVFRVQEANFNHAFKFNYIEQTVVTGVYCPFEEARVVVTYLPATVYDEDADEGDEGSIGYGEPGTNSYITAYFQYSKTKYVALQVKSPLVVINVRTRTGYVYNQIVIPSNDEAEQRNYTLNFPASFIHSTFFTMHEKELFIQDSLHMVAYASDAQWLEWYQTGAFADLLKIVIIIIAIIVLIFYDWSGTTSLTLLELGVALLVSVALQYAFKLLLIWAGDNVFLRAVVTAAYIVASIYTFNYLGADMSTAQMLLFATSAIIQSEMYALSLQFEDLQQDFDKLLMNQEERAEEIAKLEAFLGNDSGLSFLEMVTYMPIDVYEPPENFYDRTVHTMNPGVLTLDLIEGFHTEALRLPELDLRSFDRFNADENEFGSEAT